MYGQVTDNKRIRVCQVYGAISEKNGNIWLGCRIFPFFNELLEPVR